ncbi:MAG TPA: outer membrane protein assembly factor BamD, partial [Rhodospirillaceae bacterium]|nr:outer membrane protein assembly factor BamD [Rhodospirillaceae bacterium]
MTAPIGSCSGNRFRPILLGLALVLSLAACSSDDEGVAYVERPAEEIYNTAANALDSGRYQEAAQQFDEVERQHPYSEWATRAQL